MPYIRQILVVLLLFVINLRPMYPSDNIEITTTKMDLNVIIVIDDTISMLGDDQPGYDTRLDKVREDVSYIVQNLPGAKFSIVCFNNNVHVMTPFTDSVNYVMNAVDSIYPLSPSYANGTNLTDCVDTIEDLAEDAEEVYGNSQLVIFFLSDGENTEDGGRDSFADIADLFVGGAVMGYGTERGGHMLYEDHTRNLSYMVMDNRGSSSIEAVTKLDEASLREVASDLDIPYLNMTDNSALESTLTQIREGNESASQDDVKQGYVDFYYVFVLPLALLTAYEFISLKRRG